MVSTPQIKTVPWGAFRNWFRDTWQQGEHCTIIGPTGSGKSLLALEIIRLRQNTVLFLTKGRDKTADTFIEANEYATITKWPPNGFDTKIALWPRFRGVYSFDEQRAVFRNAINGTRKAPGIYEEGGWSVLIDEVMYFKEELHLEQELRMLWTQGRSNDISLVAGTQRPRDVPQLMLNQWSHLFLFQTADRYEIQRLADIGGNISNIIKENAPILDRHQFMYINRLTQQTYKSKVVK